MLEGHTDEVHCVAFSPINPSILVSGSDDGTLRFWNDGKRVHMVFHELLESVHSIEFSPDGNTLAVGAPWNDGNGSDSGHVRVYRFGSNTNGDHLRFAT